MKYVGLAASAAFLVSVPASAAETLSQYAADCAARLGVFQVPGYSCSSGSQILSGLVLNTGNNRLGRVPTSNANVDAVFLCRDYNSGAGTASLNGYILQNQITGNTCFFDAKNGASSTVPSPSAANASTYWETPGPGYDGACQTCHAGDPFIVTKGLSAAMKTQGMIRNGRNTKGLYHVVNSQYSTSHFYNWNAQRAVVTTGCMSSCHFTSTAGNNPGMVTLANSEGWMAGANYTPITETPASIAVWRPGPGAIYYYDRNGNKTWDAADQWGSFGQTGDMPVVIRGTNCAAGVNTAEMGVKRNYTWYVSSNNHWYDAPPDNANTFNFGSAGLPFSWNGTVLTYETGTWYIDYDQGRNYAGDISFALGDPNDKPIVGRWARGMGHRVGVFRNVGAEGWWALDLNGNNAWDGGDTFFRFGDAGDMPFVGDFNGDGLDEIGVFRGGWWYVDSNQNRQWNGTGGGDSAWAFGNPGDTPVVSPTKWNCSW